MRSPLFQLLPTESGTVFASWRGRSGGDAAALGRYAAAASAFVVIEIYVDKSLLVGVFVHEFFVF